MKLPEIKRRISRPVKVGRLTMGGRSPVSVQSMANTQTSDVKATLAQINALAEAGADLIRLAVPTRDDTAALKQIVRRSPVPLIADVHFHFDRALEAIDAGAAKIRLNPGNIRDRVQVRRVIAAARSAGVAIRVGVNEGSIVERSDSAIRRRDMSRRLDELMVEKLDEYLKIFRQENFHDLVLSAKSRDAFTTIAAYRALAKRYDYPLHLGVTHAGTPQTGTVRSAAALGTLLAEGIGDTIRISFAGDPLPEVRAGLELLWSLRLRRRRGLELIACPTCGRLQMDVAPIIEAVQRAFAGMTRHVTVAVMGCVVNGPGEAADADIAVCAGKGKAILYRRGKKLRVVPQDKIVQAVLAEAKRLG
ncbi:MAG: flavodoxin-dependent (E)-4-hydroxy-3-methylbut-2-enyl-diphosphate synthase [Planctomycetes bacterium]|nr:flavodoxin-dependent (E)-4-hydroxy-3-methylbut-2-enyl-diphosphate synthase [Planctomycetota bacterium]